MRKLLFWFLFLGIFIFAGCSTGTENDVSHGVTPQLSATPTQVLTSTVAPTPTTAPTATPTPTPIPGWQQVSVNSREAQNQYVLDDLFFGSADQEYVLALDGKILLLQLYSGSSQTSAQLIDINTEEILISTYITIEGGSIMKCGALNNGGFYIYDSLQIYYVYNSELEEVRRITHADFDYNWGAIARNGEYVYFCDWDGNINRVGADGVSERVMDNLDWGTPTVDDVFDDGRYVQISYYLLSEDNGGKEGWFTKIVDTQAKQITAELDGMYKKIFIEPGADKAVLARTYPSCGIEATDINEKMELSDERLNIDIDGVGVNSLDNLYIDWNRGLCIMVKCFKGQNDDTYWETVAYDLLTGEEVSSTAIKDNSINFEPTCTLLLDDGAMCFYTKTYGIVLWDYTDISAPEAEVFTKYGSVSSGISQQIAELEEKYGMYIYAGGETAVSTFDYNCEICTDEEQIELALTRLDEVFSLYPEGFFEQLKVGSVKTLGVYLVGEITPKDDFGTEYPIAFASTNGYEQVLVVNVTFTYSFTETLVHEISHWMDTKITAEQQFGVCEDFYNEYLEFCPEDFEYVYSYRADNFNYDYIYSYEKYDAGQMDQVYYVDTYAQTFPGEDRARCFEFLMGDIERAKIYFQSPHLCAKLDYFFGVIREAFDTEDWPEQTTWEERLSEVRGDKEQPLDN